MKKFIGCLFCIYPVSVLFMVAHGGLVMSMDQGFAAYLLGCLCLGGAAYFFCKDENEL